MKRKGKQEPRLSNRNTIETLACILENSNESSGKASLIHTCSLDSAQFNLFKSYLIEAGLLVSTSEDGIEIFEATERGKAFLVDYYKIKSL